eukprot:7245046-Alexandrium_andersonii.AAC.1
MIGGGGAWGSCRGWRSRSRGCVVPSASLVCCKRRFSHARVIPGIRRVGGVRLWGQVEGAMWEVVMRC